MIPFDVRRLELFLGPRAIVAVVIFAGVLAVAARALPDASAAGWIVRVMAVSGMVAIMPGMLVLLAWRPRQTFGLLELLGFSMGVSFALVQVLVVAALTFHWSPIQAVVVFGLIAAGHAVMALRHAERGVSVRVPLEQLAIMVLLAGLALFLYAAGSPVQDQEDRIHISIVQRLVHLTRPDIGNIYLSPGVVYTYPFPGTHYMLALMSWIGDIEPMFLYHKMRAFWGVAAIILLYGCARSVFESGRMALAATLAAIAFVANGTFSAVPGMYWAQMAPYSHASDVAMGVLLPALLLMASAFLRSSAVRESAFFLAATLGMACMLIVVHPREVVQFLVYLTAFGAVLALARGQRLLAVRTAVMLIVTAAVLLAYRLWHQGAVSTVDSLVSERRQDLWDFFTASPWGVLFDLPVPLLDNYMPAFQVFFVWWNPFVLLASPVVLYVLRGRPLAWLFAGSIATYLLIIRFPLLAIPYTYLTYFEILYTPVRNVVFFIHVLAGVSFYLLAAWLAQRRYTMVCVLAVVSSWAIVEGLTRVATLTASHPDILFIPVLLGYVIVLVSVLRRPSADDEARWIDEPRPRWGLAFALLLLPVAVGTWVPESAVVTASWSNPQPTPAALFANLECRDDGQFCPPPQALMRFARERVPVDAVLAVDYREAYEPTLFMPQQVVVWSGAIEGLTEPERIFPEYFEHLERARAASLEQPLFNAGETHEERIDFIRDLRVTHVLVNPRLYSMMKLVLARDADLFAPRYDDGMWALYEVAL